MDSCYIIVCHVWLRVVSLDRCVRVDREVKPYIMRNGVPVSRNDMKEYAGEQEVFESLRKSTKVKKKTSTMPENQMHEIIEDHLEGAVQKVLREG